MQRLNLAEVILRCSSHKIGALEELPLLDPPESVAVRAGYKMLYEIGAIREDKSVTRRGHQLAGLPLDPTIGAMILKGRELNLLADTIIIAAALSIQDPREDPPEKRKEARQSHSRWQHQDSDLLSYLQLWNWLQSDLHSVVDALSYFLPRSGSTSGSRWYSS
jgi:ATP-dependent helicase HrpA